MMSRREARAGRPAPVVDDRGPDGRYEAFGPLGPLLRRLRIGRGLSQNRLARQAGIDPAYISRIERGGCRPPGRAIVFAIAEGLGAPVPDRERLLVAAGYCPEALLRLEPARLDALLTLLGDGTRPVSPGI
jgi:transcriptional regulator with XRE-family HTH domain